MACYYPLQGYRARVLNPSGRRSIVFNVNDGYKEFPVTVPCGKCVGCRLEYSRNMALRCMHEAQMHAQNCMVTLTYDEAHVPRDRNGVEHLQKRDFQLFMKRLRKAWPNDKIRYFHCGEYGSVSKRPHYHALLFGFDFPDKVHWTIRNDLPVWRSAQLEQLWPVGLSEVGTVTARSAAYVARYVVKKAVDSDAGRPYVVQDKETGEVVERAREYTTCSRGGRGKGLGGIGMPWFSRYYRDIYPHDNVICGGRPVKVPRAYDKAYSKIDPEGFRKIQQAREGDFDPEDNTWERLQVKEKCAIARLSQLGKRGL